ncbi:aconitate hydratase AcnA [Limisalsivibrio acetivorans]|uniref:aconitate hydratase AcnA n=1 Tax=Limisalsivibrio acetivorans TaxID=1304888 RepID=UPI0003B461C8|nr:aconitate hydratase AcnA [Limisalsivibrio acetivorans]
MKRADYKKTLETSKGSLTMYDIMKLKKDGVGDINRLPYSIRVLVENLLRNMDGEVVSEEDVKEIANWKTTYDAPHEIPYHPARVIMQDYTGIPGVVDLAAMRDAVDDMKKDPSVINPLVPVDLIVDHSVQVDYFGSKDSLEKNVALEYERNGERYSVLKWGQKAFSNFRIVPPSSGICHQVNLEYLGKVVDTREIDGESVAICDTLVGTDSHTPMINAIGVMGWGVGGIEAEAVMLGQPYYMPIPEVVGLKLTGKIKEGITGTDVVLTITELLRKHNVVEKFVEVFGPGIKELKLPDRSTISNMSPEFGCTMSFFPVDDETLRYLRFTNREEEAELVEKYTKENGLFYDGTDEPEYSSVVELDLSTVEPCVAGPSKPQQRVKLPDLPKVIEEGSKNEKEIPLTLNGEDFKLKNGSVVIAAITSCTNTSNPFVMVGAGLVAKKALEHGLRVPPYVKTSLAPGSKVVTSYLEKSGTLTYLEALRFHLAGYGCTTCIGNAGPLNPIIEDAVKENGLNVASVLSGNRNFEARIHGSVRSNFLASPMLVVIYALAGTTTKDLTNEPVAYNPNGEPVYLKDLWPTSEEIWELVEKSISKEDFEREYGRILDGDRFWQELEAPSGEIFQWDPKSTYIRRPPYFENFPVNPPEPEDICDAKIIALLGDTVTTDHISPAGSIRPDYPAGRYLQEHGTEPADFNSYGSRRGNHEVMMRGTFGNVRIKNKLVEPKEGGYTRIMPDGGEEFIYDAAMKYMAEGKTSVVFGGKEYGTGSSRDWAAKGTKLLGIRAVIAESFERIHRSNLAGMGILPLVIKNGESWASLGIDGTEEVTIEGLRDIKPRGTLRVTAKKPDGQVIQFDTLCRLDTDVEIQYFKHGGILDFVLRKLTV